MQARSQLEHVSNSVFLNTSSCPFDHFYLLNRAIRDGLKDCLCVYCGVYTEVDEPYEPNPAMLPRTTR
jgi:hypothetical protein